MCRSVLAAACLLALVAAPASARFAADARPFDLDGDGRHDLVFVGRLGSPVHGWVRVLHVDGVAPPAQSLVPTGGGDLRLADVGDVDGDGQDELVFQALPLSPAAGIVRLDTVERNGSRQSRFLEDGGGAWTIVGLGDTDGDGALEILSQGTCCGASGVRVQRVDPGGATTSLFVPDGNGAWQLVGAADLNGDGRTELLYRGDAGSPAQGHLRIDFPTEDELFPAAGRTFHYLGTGGGRLDFVGAGSGFLVLDLPDAPELARAFVHFGPDGAPVSFFETPYVPGFSTGRILELGSADVDGDGVAEWALGSRGVDALETQAGGPTHAEFPFGGLTWFARGLLDADGDGFRDDVVFAGTQGSYLGIFRVVLFGALVDQGSDLRAPVLDELFVSGGGNGWDLFDSAIRAR